MSDNEINKANILQKIRNKEFKTIDFKNLSEELRNDKEIALEAIKQLTATVILFLSKDLRNDKEIALEAVKRNGFLLDELSDSLKDNKEVVLEAIKLNGQPLASASERLRDDKELVLKMLELEVSKSRGWTLQCASERLQNDKDCLQLLEKTNIKIWNDDYQNWHKERMDVLENIREKEFMERAIIKSGVVSKKIKF